MPEHPLCVLLMQLPVPNNPRANIPLAAGYLKAYAYQEGLLDRVAIEIMPRDVVDAGGDALIVAEIVRRRPDVLGVSLYTWNSERTLHLVRAAKAALPDLLVVAGGPEVQRDNAWVLEHPAVGVAVLGEGEQTFVALLRTLLAEHQRDRTLDVLQPCGRCAVEGLAHRHDDRLVFTPARTGLSDLAAVPSPYLLGYLELRPGDMALVECSRWCPYRCSFCLYGKNMGSRLGKRLFPLERVVEEVVWAREHGAAAVHFVEANLNLLPYFRQLTTVLADVNADHRLRLYAELRGEHLSEDAVAALVRAGLHTAEVGLQSANPAALHAVERRTDLLKWAAGTRRLYHHGVEVFLDVILGLPGDDETGVLGTLDWIAGQDLGPYDVFTLQVLPGTAVRERAAQWALRYQDRPPYYVLETDRLAYAALRALRWELKERAGFDPREVEGMPELAGLTAVYGAWRSDHTGRTIVRRAPDQRPTDVDGCPAGDALAQDVSDITSSPDALIDYLDIDCRDPIDWPAAGQPLVTCVASRVTVRVRNFDADVLRALLWPIAAANQTILWDVLIDGAVPDPAELHALRAAWPHAIGYLDRVAVYGRPAPDPQWSQVIPRFILIAPWGTPLDPLRYEGLARVLWRLPDSPIPEILRAIAAYGGDGIVVRDAANDLLKVWQEEHGVRVWVDEAPDRDV